MLKFKNNICATACNQIASICSPLAAILPYFKAFTYLKTFPNGSRVDLCSHDSWTQQFLAEYYKLNYNDNIDFHLSLNKSGLLFFDNKFFDKPSLDASQLFNINSGIGIVNHFKGVNEIFYFAFESHSHEFKKIYFEHEKNIRLFCYYFKDQAKELIHNAIKKPLPVPTGYFKTVKAHESNYLFIKQKIDKIHIQRYYLGDRFDDNYLTFREVEIIKYCSLGKTAEEVAIILRISKKTVENHINNCKLKLKCHKKEQVLLIAKELHLIN